MDFLDNAVSKAKDAFDIAYKKTNTVVNTQIQKFDVASIENKRAKDFEKLGKIYFELLKNTDIEDNDTKAVFDAIIEKNEKIDELKKKINSTKNKRICPECSAIIDDNAVFCSSCGVKLQYDSEENE